VNGKILLLAAALSAAVSSFQAAADMAPGKIDMVWDYIGRRADNLNPGQRIILRGLDVVSPTWFSIGNGAGDISSLADKNYVKWAHDNGLKVWALFENRSDDQRSFTVLSNANKRRRMADQIVGFVQEYGLDGINVDFESMSRNTGSFFEKFVAELYSSLKPLGVTLSVDIPLSINYIRTIYDVSLVAENCDYAVMMAYDQYNIGSPAAGPTASIDWVKQGIEDTLHYIPSGKVILGIPFYTRIWTENSDGVVLTSRMEGMQTAWELFRQNADIWERDSATGQIYAEYEKDLKRYRVWLEDEHSVSLKLDAINDYNLAGMSGWRAGWEWPHIWDMIAVYFK